MVFITHYWKKRLLERVAVWLCLLLLGMLPAALPAQGSANPVEVSALRLSRSAEGVLLSATLRFELPQAVEDALLKGTAVVFVAEAEILRERWYWSDKRVVSSARQMRLSFSPLTRRWRLRISNAPNATAGLVGALNLNFDSLAEALAAIARPTRWKIADENEIDPESRYTLGFAFRLDLAQLPRLFQIGTLGQADWLLSAQIRQPLQFEADK